MILTNLNKIEEFTNCGWWGEVTVDSLFHDTVDRTPDNSAVVDASNREQFTDGSCQRLTYGELKHLVDCISVKLLQAGVIKDDIVAIQLPNVVESVACILACAQLGVVVTPIASQYREHELKSILDKTRPKVYISMSNIKGHNHASMLSSMCDQNAPVQNLMAWGEDLPTGVESLNSIDVSAQDLAMLSRFKAENPHSANDILTICWTSGTDAAPKGVPIIVATAQIQEGEHLVNPFPMVNMASLGGVLFPWLMVQGKLVLHQPFDLPTYLSQIEDEGINYNLAPPPVLNRLIKDESVLANVNLESLHSVCSGSAPLAPWMIQKWQDRYGINIINFFGSNEGTTLVSSVVDVPDACERALYFPRFGRDEYSWAVDEVLSFRTRLVDPDTGRQATQVGEQGELRIWGATVFDGYYADEELNRTVFDEDGYFCTGDLFEIAGTTEKPCYYRFVGRLKEIIIRGGQNIAPCELDSLLDSHPKLQEAAVVGVPDEILGECLCVAIVPKENERIDLQDLNQFLREKNIAVFKLPERMVIVDRLPRNQLDKLVRRELQKQVLEMLNGSESGSPQSGLSGRRLNN